MTDLVGGGDASDPWSKKKKKKTAALAPDIFSSPIDQRADSPCTLCAHERSGAPLISPVSQWEYASNH